MNHILTNLVKRKLIISLGKTGIKKVPERIKLKKLISMGYMLGRIENRVE